jgi:hypothetical protein
LIALTKCLITLSSQLSDDVVAKLDNLLQIVVGGSVSSQCGVGSVDCADLVVNSRSLDRIL